MKKFTFMDFSALVVWLLPGGYLIAVYPSLPSIVPLHYDINGKVDQFGNKSELIGTILALFMVSCFVFFLFRFLPSIDPKNIRYGQETFRKIALGTIVTTSAIGIIIVFTTLHQGLKIDKLLLPVIGLLFAFMGNVMHSIQPNYFAGVRTPWTLESKDTWRATHQFASKLWFAGGIILTITSLILPAKTSFIVFSSGVGILVLIPVIYSFIYFKKHQLNA